MKKSDPNRRPCGRNGVIMPIPTRKHAETIDETNRRREKQVAFSIEYHIVPTAIKEQEQMLAGDRCAG